MICWNNPVKVSNERVIIDLEEIIRSIYEQRFNMNEPRFYNEYKIDLFNQSIARKAMEGLI